MPQFFIPLVALDSTPEYKVRNVGIVQASLLVGILASRIFSGLLAGAFGWRSVYFAAAAMMIICFALMFKILPDQQAVAIHLQEKPSILLMHHKPGIGLTIFYSGAVIPLFRSRSFPRKLQKKFILHEQIIQSIVYFN